MRGMDVVAVRPFRESDRPAWNAFVHAHPDGTFFHLAEWQDVLTPCLRPSHALPACRAQRRDPRRAAARRRSRACFSATHWSRRHSASTAASSPQTMWPARRSRGRPATWRVSLAWITSRCAIASAGTRTGRARTSTSRSARRSIPIPRRTCWPSRASSARWCARASRKSYGPRSIGDVGRLYDIYSESLRNLGTPVFSRRYLEMLQEVFGERLRHRHDPQGRSRGGKRAEFLFPRRSPAVLRRRHAGSARCGRQRLHVLAGHGARAREGLPDLRLRPQQARHRLVRLQDLLGLRARAALTTSTTSSKARRCRT